MEKDAREVKKILSATLEGIDAFAIEIEASLTKGLPNFAIVGMADEAIKESRERVKSALLLNDFSFPPLRITVSLTPADKAKKGSHFDLPIAVLLALETKQNRMQDVFCFGELGLDGRVRSTDSIFAIVLSLATKRKNLKVLVPQDIAPKVSMIFGVEVFAVQSLQEAVEFFSANAPANALEHSLPDYEFLEAGERYYFTRDFELDFKDVKGQEDAVRAALISAVGFHNILFIGSPGSGKSMISKRLRYILPPMSLADILFCAKLQSLSSREFGFAPLRPFRSPHHTATKSSIFGGGTKEASIGEIALASRGILFFDELPHFGKSTLEAMREPLEDRHMLVSRVNSKIDYETDFLFAGAMNPCPCGNLLSTKNECRCSDLEIARYKNKLSEPFLDRIDLFVQMSEADLWQQASYSSAAMQEAVLAAFALQKQRGQKHFNSRLSESEIETFCVMDAAAATTLQKAALNFGLSQRAANKIRKVARSIADLAAAPVITERHVIEALFYRKR